MMEILFHADQFREWLAPQKSRELFRACVRYVEIETFTYCNRKCWFCPNAAMPDRQSRTANRYMDEGLYLRIVGDLSSIDYAGQIQFGRYNEPLADRVILRRIRQARAACPQAYLYTHTNGDFLTRDYLIELADAGLNELCVQTYLGNNERFDEARMRERLAQQLRKLGLKELGQLVDMCGVRHRCTTDYPHMRVGFDARNFDLIGNDRAGLVQVGPPVKRTAPCLIPFTSIYVDWNGNTVPCCNIRSDRTEHADFVVSRLQDGASLFDAFVALHNWRKSLMRFGPKSKPCDTCDYDSQAVSPGSAGQIEEWFEQFAGADGEDSSV